MTGQEMIDKITDVYYPRAGAILTDAQIMEFINNSMDEVYKDINEVKKHSFKTVADQYEYTLPTYIDFDNIEKVEGTTDTTITSNSYWQEYGLYEEYTDNAQLYGYQYYNALDSKIGLYPIPLVNDQNVNIYYNTKPTKFVNATVTFEHTNNLISLPGNDLFDGDIVKFSNSGGALPAEIVSGTPYYVVSTHPNYFKISLTSGGSELDFTSNGSGTNTVSNLTNECNLKDRFHMLIVYGAIMEIATIGENPDAAIYNMYQPKHKSMLEEAQMDRKPKTVKANRWWG